MAATANIVLECDVGSRVESQAVVLIVDDRILDLDVCRARDSPCVSVVTAFRAFADIDALDVSGDLCTGLISHGAINRDPTHRDVLAVADGEAMNWGVQNVNTFNVGIGDPFDAHHLWLLDTLVSSTAIPIILTMTVDDAIVEPDDSAVCG